MGQLTGDTAAKSERWSISTICSRAPRASWMIRVLDRIDEIVGPSADVGPLSAAYNPPAIAQANLRRRPPAERAAA
jgi:hypothetical protein